MQYVLDHCKLKILKHESCGAAACACAGAGACVWITVV